MKILWPVIYASLQCLILFLFYKNAKHAGRLEQYEKMRDTCKEWVDGHFPSYNGRDWLLRTTLWNRLMRTAPFDTTDCFITEPTAEQVMEDEAKLQRIFQHAGPVT